MEQHPRIDLEAYFPCFFSSHRDGARLNACFRIVQGKESYRTYFSYFRPAGRYYSSTLVRVQYKVLVLSLLFALTFPVFACSGTVESSEMSYRTLVRKAAARLVAEVEESKRKKKRGNNKTSCCYHWQSQIIKRTNNSSSMGCMPLSINELTSR